MSVFSQSLYRHISVQRRSFLQHRHQSVFATPSSIRRAYLTASMERVDSLPLLARIIPWYHPIPNHIHLEQVIQVTVSVKISIEMQ